MANVVTGEDYYKLDGQLSEIKRQLRLSKGYPFLVDELRLALQRIIEGRFLQINSFKVAISAGYYDQLFGFAKCPEKIKGQKFSRSTGEVELDYPRAWGSTKRIHERYAGRMANLSDLLDYGMRNPQMQCEFQISIVWQDDTGEFWRATLYGDNLSRSLGIEQNDPRAEGNHHCRILVRKTSSQISE